MFLVITSKRHRISQTININHQQSCDRNHHMFVEPFFMIHQVRLKHKKQSQNHNIWFVDGLLIVNHKTQSTNILKTININHQQITKPSTLRWRCFQELMGVHRHLVPGNGPVWYTWLGTSKQHRICGLYCNYWYDVLWCYWEFVSWFWVEKPLDFTCKSTGFTFFVFCLFDCFWFCLLIFGGLLFGNGSRGVLCHSWFLRVC